MSKKIISLALAVLMLFSVCVSASAVQGDGSENIRIYMTSDAKVGATAGTDVNVSFYIDLPDGVDELDMCIGNISIGYNNTKYKLKVSDGATNGDEARTWGDDFGAYMKSTAHVVTASSSTIVGKFNADDTAKGWNSACMVQELYEGTTYKANTGFPVYDNMHIFTLTFVAQDTLTADDVIGVVEGAYGSGSYFRVCWFNGTTTAQLYPAGQVDMADAKAVAPAAAPAAPLVYSIGGKNDEVGVKKANDDGATYNIGTFFAFKTTDIAPAFNANGTSENITGITATVVANTSSGGSASIDAETIKYVYDVSAAKDKSELGFIVAINNIPNDNKVPDSDDTVVSYTITPTVTTNSGDFVGETITVVVADL